MLRLGRLPAAGDTVDLGDWTLVVESVAHQRVERARLVPSSTATVIN
jgi:CBS domain containing-hemolysin-like protein